MSEQPQYKPGDVVNGHVLGSDWKWHPIEVAPAPPVTGQAPAAPQTVVNVTNTRRGVNHLLHLILTLLTCGVWGIVWIIVVIVDAAKN